MIREIGVLLRIQHLEQRGGRVAPVPSARLINFVDENHRIRTADALQRMHQLAGERTHVRATVTFDLTHVLQPADGKSEELALESGCDALADACFSHPRRSDEAN